MKLCNRVLSLIEDQEGVGCKKEADAFGELLQGYGIEDVTVSVEKDGTDHIVRLSDGEEKETLLFGVDEDGDGYCISLDDVDLLGDFADCVDLQPADPVFAEDGSLDMTDLSWVSKSVLTSLFAEAVPTDQVSEKTKVVFRGGKKMKVVVKTRKKRLSAKQKAALSKLHRKPQTSAQKKKRALSLKIRKRAGL